MMTKTLRLPFILGWLLTLTLILTACAEQPERLWLKAPGWSRAQLVGNTRVGDPVQVTYDDQGQYYIFLFSASDGISHLRVVSLDREAQVVWDRTYPEIELTRPKQPHIIWDGEMLQLFWIDNQALYNARLDSSGNFSGAPILISGETVVDDYAMSRDSTGSIAVWYAGPLDELGLYALPPGDFLGQATLVDPQGIRPGIQYDESDTLHAVWTYDPTGRGSKPFIYAAYTDGVYSPGEETTVVAPRVFGTTVFDGPHMGLDRDHVYFFWTKTFYSGLEAGTSVAQYVYFPKGQPSLVSEVIDLQVPYSYDLAYEAMPPGDLKTGERVPLDSGFRGGSNYVNGLTPNSHPDQELVVVVQALQGYLMNKTKPQVSAIFFRDGSPIAFQQLTFTPTSSASPSVLSDDDGRLYFTWLEKGSLTGWAVYFASTAPDIRQALSSLTRDDLARLSTETLFGLLSDAVLIPFALAWLLPATIVLALTNRLRGGDQRLTRPGVLISLILTFTVYFISKLNTLPGMRDYLPFSAWIPVIPAWLDNPLRLGVPLLSAAIAFLVAWYISYRVKDGSVFVLLLIFAAVDGLITMSVYGVLVYGAF